jgi:hypothetical protein
VGMCGSERGSWCAFMNERAHALIIVLALTCVRVRACARACVRACVRAPGAAGQRPGGGRCDGGVAAGVHSTPCWQCQLQTAMR